MVIKLGKQDILKGQLHAEGWFPAVIKKFDQKKSAKGDSINFIFTVQLEDESEKEYDCNFNTKAIGMIVPFIEAVTLTKLEPNDLEIDPEIYTGKKLDVKIFHDLYDGRKIDKIEMYLPYGKGKNEVSL